jgi:hypothetical protein
VAFCSGVLLDWDLVLTAGHCARAFAVGELSAVFDFYYESPGVLAYRPESVAAVAEIVAERLDEAGSAPRLDYAWLRLKTPVSPLRRPAQVHAVASDLGVGDPIVSMSYGGGIPLKIDSGARVRDARSDSADYFTADADNFSGSSGGGAFDEGLILTGVTSRGQEDFEVTASGCRRTIRTDATESVASPSEEFTFAYQAVQGLCATAPNVSSICRQNCGDPCQALPHPASAGGCSLALGHRSPRGSELLVVASVFATQLWARRRKARRVPSRCRGRLRTTAKGAGALPRRVPRARPGDRRRPGRSPSPHAFDRSA